MSMWTTESLYIAHGSSKWYALKNSLAVFLYNLIHAYLISQETPSNYISMKILINMNTKHIQVFIELYS